jgi:hypothetical protein
MAVDVAIHSKRLFKFSDGGPEPISNSDTSFYR